jgi:mannose-6-phosphate isomerase
MADAEACTRLLQVRPTEPGPDAMGSLLHVHLAENSAGIDEVALFTPLSSSLHPVGVREQEVDVPPLAGMSFFGLSGENRVSKRWGSEHWLHAEDNSYGFKVIRINRGSRTSLQYHREKQETYFILSGLAALHTRARDGTDHVVDFPAGWAVRVPPGAIHRVEARTDIVLIEASTYDDGSDNVRIEDDWGRADGRIATEYAASRFQG